MDEEIAIKIQTLDNLFPITMKHSNTVNDLKEKINEMFNIPIINQRLIFQGKILQNNTDKLKHYKITNESVIHLVVRKTTFSDDNTINTNNINNQNTINNLNSNLNEENNIFQNNNNNNIPFLSFNRRNNMRHFRQRNIHFDTSDCIESLYQNIITISNIIKCKNKFNYSQILQSKTIKPFNLNKRKFEIGEWIDVKDTINQWLEAQIINIRTINKNTQILVHYSGWGNRWDEWIDIKSQRIANFKTYTLQSQNSIFLSPYPSINIDGFINNNFENQHRPIDIFYYLDKVSFIMNDINKSIEHMNKLRKKGFGGNNNLNKNEDNFSVNNEDKEDININGNNNFLNLNNFIPFSMNETEILMITSQIIPILDRCGRLMSDLSLLLSHLIFNPNLYPHLLFGRNNNELSDSISCTSGYSMYTNESSSIYSGITGHRFMQERDNNINNINNINILNGLNRNNQNNNISNNNIINTNSNNIINTNSNNINTNNNINNNNTNNNINNNNTNNTFSHPRYYINSSSSELPFIQRLNFSNNLHQNSNLLNPFDFFPKINLQIPPLLSPNEINMVNAYNPLDEQNIFLIGRNVLIDNSNNNITMNQIPNHNFTSNINNQNNLNNLNMNNSENNIITEMNNTKSNDNISEDNHFKNLNYTFNKNFTHIHRAGSVTSNRSTRSAEQMYTKEYKIFKYENEQNDVNLNLLKNSLNKDNNNFENYIENLSLKSDKNLSMKNKNLSYKSVSEVDEFGEYEQEDDEKKKDKDNITITSHRSLESGYMKEFLDNDDNNSNISNNNSINTNSVNTNLNINNNTFNINAFNPNHNK